jgi:MATE family multidrug resistance protein
VVGLGCLRGLSDVKIPTWFTFMAYWVIAIPLGYWLGITLGYGLEATWWALSLGLTISALLMLFRFFTLCKTVALDKNGEALSNSF